MRIAGQAVRHRLPPELSEDLLTLLRAPYIPEGRLMPFGHREAPVDPRFGEVMHRYFNNGGYV